MRHSIILMVFVLAMSSAWTQSPVQISLKTSSSGIYHDEPLLLSVTLTNPTAQSADRWNMAAENRLLELSTSLKEGKIKQQEYDAEKRDIEANKKKSGSVTVGTSASPWSSQIKWTATLNSRSVALPFTLMPNPKSSGTAVLDGKGFYRAWFGIAPAEVQKLAPGKYEVMVELQGASASVMVEVKSSAMPASLAATDSLQLKWGRFYWYAGLPVKGLEHVEKVLSANASSIGALSLKGDLLLLQNQLQPALDAYTKALEEVKKQFPGSNQVPEYLMDSIEYVKGKME